MCSSARREDKNEELNMPLDDSPDCNLLDNAETMGVIWWTYLNWLQLVMSVIHSQIYVDFMIYVWYLSRPIAHANE